MKLQETNCTFEAQGQKFTANGAWINEDRAHVYIIQRDGKLNAETWDGKVLSDSVKIISQWTIYAPRLGSYRMRSVRFTIDQVTYSGRYNSDWCELVKAKRMKGLK